MMITRTKIQAKNGVILHVKNTRVDLEIRTTQEIKEINYLKESLFEPALIR